MEIRKDTIYIINHETIDRFLIDVANSGFDIREEMQKGLAKFGEYIYNRKAYVPMTFHRNDNYVYFNSTHAKETLEEVKKLIQEAKNPEHNIYKYNVGKQVVLYSPKRMLL